MSKPNESFGLGYYAGRDEIFINREPWFVGSDVARCLGYKYPVNAIQDHVDDEDKIDGWTIHPPLI